MWIVGPQPGPVGIARQRVVHEVRVSGVVHRWIGAFHETRRFKPCGPCHVRQVITSPAEWKCERPCNDADLLALLQGMLRKSPSQRLTLEQVPLSMPCAALVALMSVAPDCAPGLRGSHPLPGSHCAPAVR